MPVPVAPPVPTVDQTLSLAGPSGDARTADLTTRALVVAVVPSPRWGREAEVLSAVGAAAEAGADVAEVPADPRLLGPAAAQGAIPVAARVTEAGGARGALAAGAALLLVPVQRIDDVLSAPSGEPAAAEEPRPGTVPPPADWPVAVLVDDAAGGRDAVATDPIRPVGVDVSRLSGADAVSEESLALAVGVRLVCTTDVRRTRRVVEVMAHLLEARR